MKTYQSDECDEFGEFDEAGCPIDVTDARRRICDLVTAIDGE